MGVTWCRQRFPFYDGFESGMLADWWTTATSTNTGRIAVTTNKAPSDGNFHVLLDTSVFDGNVNLNELVLHVDLTGRMA